MHEEFQYFYGNETEQYSFYRIPKLLFTDTRFKSLSLGAKVLYGLMLDRISISIENNWFDDEGRAYINYSINAICEAMGCGTEKAVQLIAELDDKKGIGLIIRKRLGQGKPDQIFVRKFTDAKSEIQTSEKPNSSIRETGSLDIGKTEPNYIKLNKTNRKREIRIDKRQYGTYKNVLLSDQEYQILQEEFPNDYEKRIEDVSCYIESTGKKYKNFLATIRSWARRDEHKTYRNTKKQPDYTVQEGETI